MNVNRKHTYHYYGIAIICLMVAMLLFAACSPSHKGEVDRLNTQSYAFHYRNLDSVKLLANRALQLSEDYPAGYAEACNNLAFVATAKMDYKQAKQWLEKVEEQSDNQIELLIADVQNMRLCQREARNKDFYTYRESAVHRLRRIDEEADNLPKREARRMIYARSEFNIVAATYFYYVQLEAPMLKALNNIDPDELEQDTAQYLNYLYNMGSGGAIVRNTANEVAQAEFDYLINCYMLASGNNPYPYWQAQALQAISEHIQDDEQRDFLIKNNLPAFQYLNVEQMPNQLLAGNIAQRALNLFTTCGDVYQTAGAYRTLSECYWQIHDYSSAADCLQHALDDNKAILQAPDLVASIRERLSLVYSAIDDKPKSDYNRNIYLDLQDQSRQDRQLEARAAQLDTNAVQLNLMIAAVLSMIVLVIFLLYVFDRMKRKKSKANDVEQLLQPLDEWNKDNNNNINQLRSEKEELEDRLNIAQLHIEENRKRNLEQRAKVSLVNSITPFIDRMSHEVTRLSEENEDERIRSERYEYISELTDKINQYNEVLTQWIQMRQGALSLRIESFPLQPLFDIVAKGKMSFLMKGVKLEVMPSDAVVKADRTLTLFMINTIADNARKFTAQGGKVVVSSSSHQSYVEICVEDTGMGMDAETLSHVFDRSYTGGHGFGLVNCKGIIEKYRKISSLFSVCQIQAESKVGEGSKFTFRLPVGIKRRMMIIIFGGMTLMASMIPSGCWAGRTVKGEHHTHLAKKELASQDLSRADAFADSAYFSNINGTYERTLTFADSAREYLNRHYLTICPHGKYLMVRHPKVGTAAELKWLHDSLPTNFNVILDLRNESAVAALALHKWDLYNSNNKVYTQLFREMSADSTLDDYVRTMQVSENAKMVAVVLLFLLLLQLPIAYYWLYYRHVINHRYAVEKVRGINKVLLGEESDKEKLSEIDKMWESHGRLKGDYAQLEEVVNRIRQALQKSMAIRGEEIQSLEMAEEDLNRAEYENANLHVSNAVLDNCLSALKHETMYYPSRIRQLIDSNPGDVDSLSELVDYYKSLYQILSAQAMEQVAGYVKYDQFLLSFLFCILLDKKELDKEALQAVKVRPIGDGIYQSFCVEKDVAYDASLHQFLFTALTSHLPYLVCRQIVREIGELTNLRGCGIQAKASDQGKLLIEVILPSSAVEKLKLR